MAMRELVTGGATCAVPGSSSSSSNPLGALANALTGSSSKTQQETLREIPTSASTVSERLFYPDASQLPGSEFDQPLLHPDTQASEFIRSFRSPADQSGLADAWNELQLSHVPPLHAKEIQQNLPEFEGLYNRGAAMQLQPTLDGPPQRVLSSFLQSFVYSSHGGMPFRPTALPLLGLSQGDKKCIRDRSSIMARHFFADKGEDFINAQVNALLSSLDIDNDAQAKEPLPGRLHDLEEYWNESQGMRNARSHTADGWVGEYSQLKSRIGDPEFWAHSFEQQHGANGWASEFEQDQSQLASIDQMGGVNIANLAARERLVCCLQIR